MRMPGIDGVETLRRIRALTADLVVIMVTANEDVGLARETLKLGALDYVAKPFDFDYLERTIMAGLAHGRVGGRPSAARPAAGDPWHELASAVFRATRGMNALGRAATGSRLEDAVLAAAREAASAEPDAAATLAHMGLLFGLAAELRDLTGAELTSVEKAMERARQALG